MDLKEKDYLTHLVLIHFWRRISSFLDEGLPFTCPIKDCAKQFLNFKTLVLHYGGIPHKKVGALILDSGKYYNLKLIIFNVPFQHKPIFSQKINKFGISIERKIKDLKKIKWPQMIPNHLIW